MMSEPTEMVQGAGLKRGQTRTVYGERVVNVEIEAREKFDMFVAAKLSHIAEFFDCRACCLIDRTTWIWADAGEAPSDVLKRWDEMNAPQSFGAPMYGFTCFHCGKTCRTIGEAERHFGKTPAGVARCIVEPKS